MIHTQQVQVGEGASLSCRVAGQADAPLLLFLHGFPEGAFIWDEMMLALAPYHRCVAPNLRGYGGSYSPEAVEDYRIKCVADDLDRLVSALSADSATVVAHDWGGVVAWALAAAAPAWMRQLVIINSPHPATFLRELKHNPAQQVASAYMHFLSRPDAGPLLVADDYARLWQFFTGMGAEHGPQPGAGWLTDAVRAQYREVWSHGLEGPLNYYRASPVKPPTADDQRVMQIELPPAMTRVEIPTLVIWAEADVALLPALLHGLEEHVPDVEVVRLPMATHWVIHEQPQRIVREISGFLARIAGGAARLAPPPAGE